MSFVFLYTYMYIMYVFLYRHIVFLYPYCLPIGISVYFKDKPCPCHHVLSQVRVMNLLLILSQGCLLLVANHVAATRCKVGLGLQMHTYRKLMQGGEAQHSKDICGKETGQPTSTLLGTPFAFLINNRSLGVVVRLKCTGSSEFASTVERP